MMLAVSSLMTSAFTGVACALSPASCRTPSRNPCMVRVAGTRYRNEPYGFRVLPPSPMAAASLEAAMSAAPAVAPQAASPMPSAGAFTAVSASRRPAPVYALPAALAPAAPSAVAQSPVKGFAAPAKALSSSLTRYAFVDFKHESKTFVAPFKVSVGDVVVVEGDRGENIGTVTEITTDVPTYAVPCKIVRRATARDLEQLATQRAKEAAAAKTCQAAVETLGLRATVVDCEYQFDLNKLTIFVKRASRNAFVDFRKLQRGLFRDFRCRIWLSYMDEVEEARAAPRFQ